MKRAPLLILACLVTITNSAGAGVAIDARFALHRKEQTIKGTSICSTYSPNGTNTPCNSFVTTAPTLDYSLVYIVLGHGPIVGINGASFGIDYNGRYAGGVTGDSLGIDPAWNTFYFCGDGLPFPNDGGLGDFPAPKGGIRGTWFTCQKTNVGGFGSQAVFGALRCYAYAPDQLSITPNNNLRLQELAISYCDGSVTQFLEVFPPFAWYALMGRVDFGGGAGLNPCLIVPTRQTTWGKIKAAYKN